MFYPTLFQKSFQRNLQYRLAHLMNNAGSVIFGFIYIAIWQGTLGQHRGVAGYTEESMTYYLAFNQGLLWWSTFLPPGLGIQDGVRSGAVSLLLMRPTNFFLYHLVEGFGNQVYNLFFRSFPILLVYWITFGLYAPQWDTWPLLILSILLSGYIGLLLTYLVGILSFWTTDNRWAHMLNFTLTMTFAGNFVPIDLFPETMARLSAWLPYAALNYYPSQIYLERMQWEALFRPFLWSFVLTMVLALLTAIARRKMEVQGG